MSKYLSNSDRNRFIRLAKENLYNEKRAGRALSEIMEIVDEHNLDCGWAMDIINESMDEGLSIEDSITVLKTKVWEKEENVNE